MRKITQDAVRAFEAGDNYKNGNTEVRNGLTRGTTLCLHGSAIAWKTPDGLVVSLAGWPTVTTRERLNGIDGVTVTQAAGVQYLNGKEWDGSPVVVSLATGTWEPAERPERCRLGDLSAVMA